MNNFTGGALTDKLESRDDSDLYMRSGLVMANMMPMSQGGMIRTPGTQLVETVPGPVRLVEFPVSGSVVYIVEIRNLALRFRRGDVYVENLGSPLEIPHPWTSDEIFEVQFARDATAIYFAHENHPPKHLTYLGLDSFQVDAEDELPSVDFTTNPDETLPFQGSGNYPRAVAIWGGRLWFGGTISEPGTIWASNTFDYPNHEYYEVVEYTYTQLSDNQTWADPTEPETEEVTTSKNVTSASHAMKLVPASGRNNYILSMAPGRDLVVNTMETEFVIPEGVSATRPKLEARTSFGASAVQSILGDNAVIFVQGSGTKVREYTYRSDNEGYASPELTFQNDQICLPGIVSFAMQREPEPVLWFVLNDGTLAAFLYNKSAAAAGWFSYNMPGATITSVCVIPGAGADDVYIAVSRGGVYSIEKLAPFYPTSRGACRYLQSFVEATSSGTGVVSGLDHLEGLLVNVWGQADEGSLGAFTVSGNQIDLGASLADTDVVVGINYLSQWKSLKLTPPRGRGRDQNIFELRMRFWRSDAAVVSYDNDSDHEEPVELAGVWYTGDADVPFNGDWGKDAYVYIESVGPAPLAVLSFETEQEVS